MELVKDHAPRNSTLFLIQSHPYYENEFAEASDNGSPGLYYSMEENQMKMLVEEDSSSEKSIGLAKNFAATSPSSLSSPSSTNPDGFGNQASKYRTEDGHSLINFNAGYGNFANAAGSLFSFERLHSPFTRVISNQYDYSVWEDNLQYNYQNQLNSRCGSNTPNPRILENSNNIETSSNYASTTSTTIPFGWLSTGANPEATINNDIQDLARQEPCTSNKRSFTGESTQSFKKQCNVAKTLKSKSTASASKDPQSVAAKNRRERISERLKILQDLVPNGSKVDLVTMLERAISYVKFLQLQVKVLATDEFWPEQGAKAPDLSQVKEAVDPILASQRDRNSSSSKSQNQESVILQKKMIKKKQQHMN